MSTACRSGLAVGWDPFASRSKHRFPQDLREWLKSPALLQAAQAIAQEHTASGLRPVFSLKSGRFHHPWRMLTAITYAYASGMYHSGLIALAFTSQPRLLELCHGHPPSAEVIRRFRIQNRTAILRCLEQLLRGVWCQHHNIRAATLHPLLLAEILCEARNRLRLAEQADSVPTEDVGVLD